MVVRLFKLLNWIPHNRNEQQAIIDPPRGGLLKPLYGPAIELSLPVKATTRLGIGAAYVRQWWRNVPYARTPCRVAIQICPGILLSANELLLNRIRKIIPHLEIFHILPDQDEARSTIMIIIGGLNPGADVKLLQAEVL